MTITPKTSQDPCFWSDSGLFSHSRMSVSLQCWVTRHDHESSARVVSALSSTTTSVCWSNPFTVENPCVCVVTTMPAYHCSSVFASLFFLLTRVPILSIYIYIYIHIIVIYISPAKFFAFTSNRDISQIASIFPLKQNRINYANSQ